MRTIILFSLIGILFVGLIIVGLQIFKIYETVPKISYDNKPFNREVINAPLRFLFVGDSTALGTGAQSNTESVAGWFGQEYLQASIENRSANGKRLVELVNEFPPPGNRKYDLVVVQIGGNDILKFSHFRDIDQQITTIIKRAKEMSKNIVILHSGNVGLAPVFIWPINEIMTQRARIMRALYIKKAAQEGVLYVDLFTERSNDLFLKDVNKYYSPDHLHPSGQGYHWWYERIRWTLDQAGVKFL
jgi:lysophospholipase L1-like esterase